MTIILLSDGLYFVKFFDFLIFKFSNSYFKNSLP